MGLIPVQGGPLRLDPRPRPLTRPPVARWPPARGPARPVVTLPRLRLIPVPYGEDMYSPAYDVGEVVGPALVTWGPGGQEVRLTTSTNAITSTRYSEVHGELSWRSDYVPASGLEIAWGV